MVKTLGLSPVKTRLAATIDSTSAEHVYRLSTTCIEELLKEWGGKKGCYSYWAVAEPEALY